MFLHVRFGTCMRSRPPSPQPSRAPKLRRSLDQITLSTRSAALVIKTRKEKPGCCRTRTRGAPPRRPEHLGWSPTSLSTGCTSTATPTAAEFASGRGTTRLSGRHMPRRAEGLPPSGRHRALDGACRRLKQVRRVCAACNHRSTTVRYSRMHGRRLTTSRALR
jgi:hypothetical protein